MVDKLINDVHKNLEQIAVKDPKRSTVPVSFDLDALRDNDLEKNAHYATMLASLQQQAGPAGRNQLSEWNAKMMGSLFAMLEVIRRQYISPNEQLPISTINKVYQCYQTMQQTHRDATAGPAKPLSSKDLKSPSAKEVRFQSTPPTGRPGSIQPMNSTLSPIVSGENNADNAINKISSRWGPVALPVDTGEMESTPARGGSNQRIPRTPGARREPEVATSYGTFKDGDGYTSSIKATSLIDQEHLEYNRQLHVMARENDLVEREREARDPAKQTMPTKSKDVPRQPSSAAGPGGGGGGGGGGGLGGGSRGGGGGALPRFQARRAHADFQAPLQPSAFEMISEYAQRDLYSSYRTRMATLYPPKPVLPTRPSMRDSPNLIPTPVPIVETDGPGYKFRAAPDRTRQVVAATRANMRPHTAPAPLSSTKTEDAFDAIWLKKRLRQADEGQYLNQIRTKVVTWSRGRARQEEESLRRQEASRFASQTGDFQHKGWVPKDGSYQGILPVPLDEHVPAEPKSMFPSNSDDNSADEVMVAESDPTRVFLTAKDSSSNRDSDDDREGAEGAGANDYGLTVSTGPLPTPRHQQRTMLEPSAMMLSPYSNIDYKPSTRQTRSHQADAPGFTSPHPETVCPDRPYGKKPERLADVIVARAAAKKLKKKKGAKKKKPAYVPRPSTKKVRRRRAPPAHVPSARREEQLQRIEDIQHTFASHSIAVSSESIQRAFLLPEDRIHAHCVSLLPRPSSALISDPIHKILKPGGKKKRKKRPASRGGARPAPRPATAPARSARPIAARTGSRPAVASARQPAPQPAVPSRMQAGNMIASLTTGVRPQTTEGLSRGAQGPSAQAAEIRPSIDAQVQLTT